MQQKKYLIVIAGPTASGKTAMGIELAKHFNTSILSADSRQFYKELKIGTAKPDISEMQGIPHYFIDSLNISTPFSVGDFEREGLKVLEKLFESKNVVLLLGGSGLFINALCEGLNKFPEVHSSILTKLEEERKNEGMVLLQEKLKKLDPDYAKKVDLQNPQRVIRALSVIEASGETFSSFLNKEKEERNFTPIFIQLYHPREVLYQRINKRVDSMVENGLEEEVKNLLSFRDLNALRSVGYQEWFDYFDGKISKEEAIELIKRNSRRYAKRQMTWFRKESKWMHFKNDKSKEVIQTVEFLMENEISFTSLLKKNEALHVKDQNYEVKLLKNNEMIAAAEVLFSRKNPPQISQTITSNQLFNELELILQYEIDYYLELKTQQ